MPLQDIIRIALNQSRFNGMSAKGSCSFVAQMAPELKQFENEHFSRSNLFKELQKCLFPSKTEWDLTNGPLSKLLELLGTQV